MDDLILILQCRGELVLLEQLHKGFHLGLDVFVFALGDGLTQQGGALGISACIVLGRAQHGLLQSREGLGQLLLPIGQAVSRGGVGRFLGRLRLRCFLYCPRFGRFLCRRGHGRLLGPGDCDIPEGHHNHQYDGRLAAGPSVFADMHWFHSSPCEPWTRAACGGPGRAGHKPDPKGPSSCFLRCCFVWSMIAS